jgi:hypothetical protein
MLIDRSTLTLHRPWLLAAIVVSAGTGVWYAITAAGRPHLPGGGSALGLTCGIGAALLILFELALWARKHWRHRRPGRARIWLAAHLWLGLLVAPLVCLHSGFRLGGSLSTLTTALLAAVLVSGVYGLWRQQRLPRRMIAELPEETTSTAIAAISRRIVAEAEVYVQGATGLGEPPALEHALEARHTIGALRASVRVMPRAPIVPSDDAAPLHDAFTRHIRPYLLEGAHSTSELRQPDRCRACFEDLARQLPDHLEDGLRALQAACDQRRAFDVQLQLHARLHRWLAVHLTLSLMLLVVLGAHIVYALRYM